MYKKNRGYSLGLMKGLQTLAGNRRQMESQTYLRWD
jgi:hypothetical protein